MAETIHVRGEGGQVIAMDLPLPEYIADRLTKGQLRRVTEDGSEYQEPNTEDVPAPPTEQPPASAVKALWVGWAVVKGADPVAADAMTKQELIDKYSVPPSG